LRHLRGLGGNNREHAGFGFRARLTATAQIKNQAGIASYLAPKAGRGQVVETETAFDGDQ
jgi:hypothetical protein